MGVYPGCACRLVPSTYQLSGFSPDEKTLKDCQHDGHQQITK
jgi:hypothetical protein